MKRPAKFLGKRDIACVMQISDELHEKMMKSSKDDFEDLGYLTIDDNNEVKAKLKIRSA
jgi:hypothetical protein